MRSMFARHGIPTSKALLSLEKGKIMVKMLSEESHPSRLNRARYWLLQEIGNRFELMAVALFNHRDRVDSALRGEEWP